jgi:hypothetical protein
MTDRFNVAAICSIGYYSKEQNTMHDYRIIIPIILDMQVKDFK